MKRSKFIFLISAVIFLFFISHIADACTVAVVSSKGTKDGRPLLWKNRDSSFDANKVMSFNGEKYSFIGLINSKDAEGKEVWAGVNSAGFCVMNAASYNLNTEEKRKEKEDSAYKMRKDEEGFFMKKALGVCATVDDFEQLLKDTKGDRGIEANFGVIDAAGGAVFFETDNRSYTKYDANDPRIAPEGYIVRTNYSFVGERNEGHGYIRYDRVAELFHQESARGGIDKDWLITIASRDMVNSLTGENPLSEPLPLNRFDRKMYYVNDSFVRRSACATVVFRGVRKGEDAGRTIMWTRLGHPLCSVVLPLWVSIAEKSELCTGNDNAPIDRFALYWLERIFPYRGGSRNKYLNLAPLVNRQGSGMLQKLITIETKIIHEADRMIFREDMEKLDLFKIQKTIEDLALTLLRKEFPEASSISEI
jgi:hypothetical protein